jgi:hypothetical protein
MSSRLFLALQTIRDNENDEAALMRLHMFASDRQIDAAPLLQQAVIRRNRRAFDLILKVRPECDKVPALVQAIVTPMQLTPVVECKYDDLRDMVRVLVAEHGTKLNTYTASRKTCPPQVAACLSLLRYASELERAPPDDDISIAELMREVDELDVAIESEAAAKE